MPISKADLDKAYLAYFGRPADFTGYSYFENKELADVIAAFDASKESKDMYGDNVATKVNAIYNNLFNRDAEPAGLAHWVALINQGRITAAGAAMEILKGALGTDATAVQNKLAASAAFVAEMDTTQERIEYTGMGAAASARAWLANVDHKPETLAAAQATAAQALLDAIAAGDGGNGQGTPLTVGTDILSSNKFFAGLEYTPGGDDRVNTLQDEDQLTGIGAATVLNATLGNANDNGGSMITPKLVNINTINAAFSGSSGAANGRVDTLDLQDSSGVDAINITRIAEGFGATVQNITSAASQLSVKNSQARSADIAFTFLGSAVAGNADSTTLTVSNVNARSIVVEENAATPQEGFETINLVSSGAANRLGTLQAEDLKTLAISGKQDLRLGGDRAINGTQGVEATTYTNGLAHTNGSLTKVDATAFEGDLDLTLSDQFQAGLDGTSGLNVNLTVLGGKGDDTIRLVGSNFGGATATRDDIDGGEGRNTLVVMGATTIEAAGTAAAPVANIKNVQALEVRTGHQGLGDATINANAFDKLETIYVRNEGNDGTNSMDVDSVVTLNNLTAVQAAAITVAHGTSGNNGIDDLALVANLKDATGASDTVGITIVDGVNSEPRFNFVLTTNADLPATTGREAVENLTFDDKDTESNTVALASVADHIGTITLKGGAAGQFFNLDTAVDGTNGGLYDYATTGLAGAGAIIAPANAGVVDHSQTAGQVRFVGKTIDASAYAGNVVVRVDTPRDATGTQLAEDGQSIKMGAGDDTVIFDKLNDDRAGLTISDTVSGGAGKDTLVIDGDSAPISLSASEWTNVSGFETIRLVGNNTVPLSNLYGENSYNLVLTNELIANNGVGGLIAIVNDNDTLNDATGKLDTANTAVESAVTIDATKLNSASHFSYNGEEGASATADRFILADANINGANVIDGGAADNVATTFGANVDVLEVRDGAVVSSGDLANIKNVGIIALSNSTALAQTTNLEFNDKVLDALVDSYHTASTSEKEVMTVRVNDVADIPTQIALTALKLDVKQVSSKFIVNVALNDGALVAVKDDIALGLGSSGVTVTGFDFALDDVILSKSLFTKLTSAVGGNIAAADLNSSAAAINAATDASAAAIVFDQTTGAVYYNTDGATAGGLVLIGNIGAGAADATNFFITG